MKKYWNTIVISFTITITVAALRSKPIKYGKHLLKLREFLTSGNNNFTFLWLVTQCSLVVIFTNVLVAFTVRAKRLLLPWRRRNQIFEMSVLMHQITSIPSASCTSLFHAWSCLSFGKDKLSLWKTWRHVGEDKCPRYRLRRRWVAPHSQLWRSRKDRFPASVGNRTTIPRK